MAARKIKGSWWVDFQARYHRYRYRSPQNTREGALAFEARLRHELATHGEIRTLKQKNPNSVPAPTLTEFAPRWIEGYVTPNNRPKEQKQKAGALKNHLIPAFGNLQLDKIIVEHIERYKGIKQTEKLNPKTINNHLAILHKLLVTAKDWGLIPTVPHAKPLKVPDPPFKHLSRADTTRLVSVAPEGLWRTMILLAVRTGLRYSEISGLQWDDVNFERGIITVRRSLVEGEMGSTKNNRVRHIPLTPDLLTALEKLRSPSTTPPSFQEGSRSHRRGNERSGSARPDGNCPLFLFGGLPVLYKTARLHLQKYCSLADIPIVSWHDLRHTFASQLVASSAPILAVQKLLGHADIKMTMRYSHLEPEVLRNVICLLEPSPGT